MSKKVSRKKREQLIAEDNLNMVKEEIVNSDDKILMADQCYHNRQACEIGTYNSRLVKYAVYYRNRWFFVAYKRDDNKVTSLLEMCMLEPPELLKFHYYKNRLENAKRSQRVRNLEPVDQEEVVVENNPAEVPIEQVTI